MYHHVADAPTNPLDLVVSPRRFAEHMATVRRYCNPVSLTELLDGMLFGTIRHRGVAVTFDDGYTDNMLNAEPELARFGIPATMFVACGSGPIRRQFWWDTLEQIFLSRQQLPPSLRVGTADWSLEMTFDESTDVAEQTQTWRAWEAPLSTRHQAFATLVRRLDPLTPSEQERVVSGLEAWAGRTRAALNGTRLGDSELVDIVRRGVIDLGAHGVSHARLALLPVREQMAEVQASRAYLQRLTDTAVPAFAYPGGSFGPETVGIVRESGFSLACTTEAAAVEAGTDPFRLPRLHVGDESGEQLRLRLDKWLAPS
jgi:peptidoglycan/xylan/chitin deacetylase (PgdA/CDA1 family)